MKIVGLMAIWFASFCFSLLADDSNPYSSIVVRNIFSLVPMPTNDPADTKPADPPAKITPNGIMSLFGQLQVLFKVATPPKPGQPPQDQSYVMSEGDRQDGIAVTKIDEQAGMITFDNHGVIQTLALTSASDASTSTTPADGAGGHGFMPPGRRFGGRMGQARNFGNPSDGSSPGSYSASSGNNNSFSNGNNPSANPVFGSGTPSYGGNNSSQQANQLSPEAQVLIMEQNRINTQDLVNQGLAPPFPPTPITPSDATGIGGNPLVSGPPAVPARNKLALQ